MGHRFDDALAIDRHGERPPHQPVIQWRPRHVYTIKIRAEIWIDAQEFRAFAAIAINAVNWYGVGDVQLSGAKGAFLDVVAVDRVKNNFI